MGEQQNFYILKILPTREIVNLGIPETDVRKALNSKDLFVICHFKSNKLFIWKGEDVNDHDFLMFSQQYARQIQAQVKTQYAVELEIKAVIQNQESPEFSSIFALPESPVKVSEPKEQPAPAPIIATQNMPNPKSNPVMAPSSPVLKVKKAKYKILAEINGNVIIDAPFSRKLEEVTHNALWKWNKFFRAGWIVGPILFLIGLAYVINRELFMGDFLNGPPEKYTGIFQWDATRFLFENETVILQQLLLYGSFVMLSHTIIIGYSFIYSYLDYFSKITRASQRSVRGIDVIERIRRHEIMKTTIAQGMSLTSTILIFIGISHFYVPYMNSQCTYVFPADNTMILNVAAAVFLILFAFMFLYGLLFTENGWKTGLKVAYGYRFFVVIALLLLAFSQYEHWANLMYGRYPNFHYEIVLYFGLGLYGVMLAYVVANYKTFLQCRQIEDVYEPDTFPIISPKNIYEFSNAFSDPLNAIQLKTRQDFFIESVKKGESQNIHLLTKRMILLHVIQTKLRVTKGRTKVEKSETIDMNTLISELDEAFKDEPMQLIEVKLGPDMTDHDISRYIFNQIALFLGMGQTGSTNGLPDAITQSKNNSFLKWVFGVEVKDEDDAMNWKKNFIKDHNSKMFGVELKGALEVLGGDKMDLNVYDDILNRYKEIHKGMMQDLIISITTQERIVKNVSQFFILIDRLINEVSNGMFPFDISSDDPNPPTGIKDGYMKINAYNSYFDMESRRECKENNIINVMAMLYNGSDKPMKAKVECLAPGFSPSETTIALELDPSPEEIKGYYNKLVQNHKANSEAKKDILREGLRNIPFLIDGKKDDDLLKFVTEVLNNSKIIWIRLQVKEKGLLPLNLYLKDENDNVINGQTITITADANLDRIVQYFAAGLAAFAGTATPIYEFIMELI